MKRITLFEASQKVSETPTSSTAYMNGYNTAVNEAEKEIAELTDNYELACGTINYWMNKYEDLRNGLKKESTRDNPSQVEPLVKCSIRSTDYVNNDGNGYCKYDITDCDYAKVKEQPSSLTTEESKLNENRMLTDVIMQLKEQREWLSKLETTLKDIKKVYFDRLELHHDQIKKLEEHLKLMETIRDDHFTAIQERLSKLEASCIMDNPICQFCGKYKTLQGNGMIHPLCECGSITKIK